MTIAIEQPIATPSSEPIAWDIDGDVGAAGGDIKHEGNLKVRGKIHNAMKVEVAGELVVGDGIEAADVRATKSITVNGNILGHGKGHCVFGSGVAFRVANGAHIESSGDVVASVEIVESRIIAAGEVKCELAHIYGGQVTANGGVVCDILGCAAGLFTLVEPGIDERLRRLGGTRAVEIAQNFKKIHKVRSEIGPLLAKQKTLTAKQKEIATEMLYEASELEERTETLIRDLRRLVVAIGARTKPQVVVNKTIYPGVTIRFKGVETEIKEEIAGPVMITIRPRGVSHQIVLTKMASNKTVPLVTSSHADSNLAALDDAIAERPKLPRQMK